MNHPASINEPAPSAIGFELCANGIDPFPNVLESLPNGFESCVNGFGSMPFGCTLSPNGVLPNPYGIGSSTYDLDLLTFGRDPVTNRLVLHPLGNESLTKGIALMLFGKGFEPRGSIIQHGAELDGPARVTEIL